MTTTHISLSMSNANSVARCVELISEAPIVEGMEGVEFSAEQLAGQWAADYAIDSDTKLSEIDEATLDAFVDIVEEHCAEEGGAEFDHAEALAHALNIVRARQARDENEMAFL